MRMRTILGLLTVTITGLGTAVECSADSLELSSGSAVTYQAELTKMSFAGLAAEQAKQFKEVSTYCSKETILSVKARADDFSGATIEMGKQYADLKIEEGKYAVAKFFAEKMKDYLPLAPRQEGFDAAKKKYDDSFTSLLATLAPQNDQALAKAHGYEDTVEECRAAKDNLSQVFQALRERTF